jgi:hypothetical protein
LKCRGAALVEFAIVLPIIIILAFGFTELGRALYQQNQLSKEVSVGARYVARYADAVNSDCGPGAEWAAATVWASNQVAATLNNLTPGDVVITVEGRSIAGVPGSICIIQVIATMNFDAVFGDSIVPLLNLGPITLSARTEERYLGN